VSRFFAYERRFAVKNMPKKVRKGSTLAEICVVLAVVSIVSTVVLSFCMMANRRAVASANHLRIMEERKMIETIVETWCDSMAAEGKAISTAPWSNSWLVAGESTIALGDDGMLIATMPEGPSIQFKCDVAKTLEFRVIFHDLSTFEGLGDAEKKDLLNDVLIVCTVEFNDPYADPINSPTYVFTVNPRISESIPMESKEQKLYEVVRISSSSTLIDPIFLVILNTAQEEAKQ
jgi:type II secretory pathway pseudopilin PulG